MIYTKKLPLISGFSFIALVDTEEQAKALSNKYFQLVQRDGHLNHTLAIKGTVNSRGDRVPYQYTNGRPTNPSTMPSVCEIMGFKYKGATRDTSNDFFDSSTKTWQLDLRTQQFGHRRGRVARPVAETETQVGVVETSSDISNIVAGITSLTQQSIKSMADVTITALPNGGQSISIGSINFNAA